MHIETTNIDWTKIDFITIIVLGVQDLETVPL